MSSIFFERVKILKSNKLLLITLISLVIIGSIILVNYLSFSDIEEVIINDSVVKKGSEPLLIHSKTKKTVAA